MTNLFEMWETNFVFDDLLHLQTKSILDFWIKVCGRSAPVSQPRADGALQMLAARWRRAIADLIF